MLSFPNSGGGRPWARLDARTGMLLVSAPDGGKEAVNLKGKVISVDIANAEQGWLCVSAAGADWQPITGGAWGNPPSAEHKPGVEVDIYSKDAAFGDAPIRSARGNSRGWNTWIGEIAKQAGGIPPGKWPTLKVTDVAVVKVGQGSSVNIGFTMAPIDKWTDGLAAQQEADEAAPEEEEAEF